MEFTVRNKIILFPRLNKILIFIFAFAFIIAALRGYQLFQYIFSENVKSQTSFFIPSQASFDQVLDTLKNNQILLNERAFVWVAKRKDYPDFIKPGKYLFFKGMNTNQMVNTLKAGNQQSVSLIFNNIRFMEELAGKVAKQIESDSSSILSYLNNEEIITELGFDRYNFRAMFIPNTYEIYWTCTPKEFVHRMKQEYDRFWTHDRIKKASKLDLNPVEVSILASIVQEESLIEEEKKTIAGLYVNRIKKGMLLQADPTLKFAHNDFSITRILKKHLEIDSPFNSYKNMGLPPGPINFPEITSIEAVLNAEKHNYLYMCASDNFDGTHKFARTLRQHNSNARKYQRALNKNKIFR